MKHPLLTEEQARFWFERMREYDITVLEQRKRLIDTFVNALGIDFVCLIAEDELLVIVCILHGSLHRRDLGVGPKAPGHFRALYGVGLWGPP